MKWEGQEQSDKVEDRRGATPTACGTGQTAMGPFYCPGDRKVYIDLAFFGTLSQRLGAPGDFAQAYVIAHEVGHHVQNLMGVTDKVDAARPRQSETQRNAVSVRVELQADCLAGVWAHHSQQGKGWLEQGDIEEALNAASPLAAGQGLARAGRHRGGAQRRQPDRRRHPAKPRPGAHRARQLHPWQQRAARGLVPARPGLGQRGAVQHLRGAPVGRAP